MLKCSSSGLSIKEVLDICVDEKFPKEKSCDKVPMMVDRNAVFVIDLSVVNIFDITADDCGAYSKHSSPSTGVEVDVDDEGVCGSILMTISKENAHSLPGTANKRRFLVKRQYSWHTLSRDYKCIISKVEENGKLLRYAIVQYIVKTANASSLFERRHGNSKKSQEPYIRTKPSVMKKNQRPRTERKCEADY